MLTYVSINCGYLQVGAMQCRLEVLAIHPAAAENIVFSVHCGAKVDCEASSLAAPRQYQLSCSRYNATILLKLQTHSIPSLLYIVVNTVYCSSAGF